MPDNIFCVPLTRTMMVCRTKLWLSRRCCRTQRKIVRWSSYSQPETPGGLPLNPQWKFPAKAHKVVSYGLCLQNQVFPVSSSQLFSIFCIHWTVFPGFYIHPSLSTSETFLQDAHLSFPSLSTSFSDFTFPATAVLFKNGILLINNVVIISVDNKGTQPCVYMYPLSPTLPSHPGCHVTVSRVSCAL